MYGSRPANRRPKMYIAGDEKRLIPELFQEIHPRTIPVRKLLEDDVKERVHVGPAETAISCILRKMPSERAPGAIARCLAPTETGRPQKTTFFRIMDGTRLLRIAVIRRAKPSASMLRSTGKTQKLPQATARPSSWRIVCSKAGLVSQNLSRPRRRTDGS